MADVFQTTFSNAFSWLKIFEVQLKFHWICSQGSNWQYANIVSDNGLAPNRRQAIIWTNDGLGCRRICIHALLDLNDLNNDQLDKYENVHDKQIVFQLVTKECLDAVCKEYICVNNHWVHVSSSKKTMSKIIDTNSTVFTGVFQLAWYWVYLFNV